MKQCPQCRRTYADETLSFCLEDGSPLVGQIDAEATRNFVPAVTEQFEAPRVTTHPAPNSFQIAPLYTQSTPPQRSKLWIIPASIAVLLAFVGGGFAVYLLTKNNSNAAPASNVSTLKSNIAANNSSNAATNSASNIAASNSASNIAAANSAPERSNVTGLIKPPSAKLVGTWITDVKEQGVKMRITYTLDDDGTSKMLFKTSDGQTGRDSGTWRFSEDVLYEKFSDGSSGKGAIRMIDEDTFEITIIDNGTPSFTGVKRVYYRKK